MSDEKKYTQRDLVLAQREAFRDGAQALYYHEVIPAGPSLFSDALDEVRENIDKRYPFPRVTRPRVVRDTAGDQWRIRDGKLEVNCSFGWESAVSVTDIDMETLKRLSDLLANPTETVDADD